MSKANPSQPPFFKGKSFLKALSFEKGETYISRGEDFAFDFKSVIIKNNHYPLSI
jgi:hypothetical protein